MTALQPPAGTTSTGQPHLSVVIPALNEEAVLGACLESLRAQDYPGQVEIIVVNNGSTDATPRIAGAFGASVVHETTRGVCHARQRGTVAARGEIVVSTDADTTFPPTWLSDIAAAFDGDETLVASCGPCRFVDAPWWAKPYCAIVFGTTAWLYRRTRHVLYASATNIAFRRAAWTGYDLTLTQGGDELGLLRELRRRGRVQFDPRRCTLTSSRRLHRGLVYNLFVTCLFFYLGAYALNRLAGRTVIGSAPTIRGEHRRAARAAAGLGGLAGAVVLWHVLGIDVV